MAAVLSIVLALLKAIPALEQLFRAAIGELDKSRARAAAQRHADKDALVDAAVDAAGKDGAQ